MKYHSIKNKLTHSQNGMTLIEVLIYSVLLSVLMLGFIQYALTIHFNNITLQNDLYDAQK